MSDGYSCKIAIASTDGQYVNVHFGRAERFLIYGLKEDGDTDFLEERNVNTVCHGGYHLVDEMRKKAESFSDCEYVIALKIGDGAVHMLGEYGISPIEHPGDIEEALDKLIRYRKVENLFG